MSELWEEINRLKDALNDSKKIVVFSGAGLSTNSGIPDFRSANGIYSKKYKETLSPEEIISHTFFMNNPEEFYEFYYDKMVYLDAKPNIAHKYFAKLEDNHDVSVVTQNIDNLHQLAGSKKVYELHGTIMNNYCMKCNKYYSINDIFNKIPPKCECGGLIKPDVVLYEEGLNDNTVNGAIKAISECDMLIIVGTSLVVYPAASFVRFFRGKYLVLLNKSETQADKIANIVIHDDMKRIVEELEK